MGATCGVRGCEMRMGCELLWVRDARVITLKNRRMWCEMRSGATCGVVGARCVWVRDAPNNVISVLGVRVAAWCEMRIFLDWCESLCPPFKYTSPLVSLSYLNPLNNVLKNKKKHDFKRNLSPVQCRSHSRLRRKRQLVIHVYGIFTSYLYNIYII